MELELPASGILEFTGNRMVSILSCSDDNRSFIVVLTVKANGFKLPPKVFCKGSGTAKSADSRTEKGLDG